jgi:hypothetical protein
MMMTIARRQRPVELLERRSRDGDGPKVMTIAIQQRPKGNDDNDCTEATASEAIGKTVMT